MSANSHLLRYRLALAGALICFYIIIAMGYVLWHRSQHADPWQLVPGRALVALEVEQPAEAVVWAKGQGFLGQVLDLPGMGGLSQELTMLDTLLAEYPQRFAGRPLRLVLLPDISSQYAWGHYLQADAGAERKWGQFADEQARRYGFQVVSTKYEGHTVYRVSRAASASYYLAFFKDQLVGSRSRNVVEQSLKAATYGQGLMERFADWPKPASPISALINLREVSQWLKVQFPALQTDRWPWYGAQGLVRIMLEDGQIRMEGQFQGKNLAQMPLATPQVVLSEQTALALSFQLPASPGDFLLKLDPAEKPKPDLSNLIPYLGGEVTLMIEGSRFSDQTPRVLALQVSDVEKALATLPKKAFRSVEALKGFYRMDEDQFPAALLGPLGQGFERCYVTSFGGRYLVFGDNLRTLRLFVNQQGRKQGRQWQQTGSVHTLVNVGRAWNLLASSANEPLSQWMEAHRRILLNLQQGQFALSAGKPCQAVWQWINASGQQEALDPQPLLLAREASPIRTRPVLFPNQYSGRNSLLIQNEANDIKLIGADGKPQWTVPTEQPILTPIQLVDYRGNGQPQAFFAAHHQIYMLDALGRLANYFPFTTDSTQAIRHISAGDFAGKQNNAIVAINEREAFAFDRERIPLGEWAPLPLPAPTVGPAMSLSIKEQGYLLFVFENGMIWLLGQDGRNASGFPINLNLRLSNPPIVRQGETQTEVMVLANTGEILKFGLDGRILSRELLFHPRGPNKISLILDEANRDNWIVAEQERLQLWIYDQEGQLLFSKKYLNPAPKEVQFFNFGNHAEIITVTEPNVSKTHVYTLSGKEVFSRALASDHLVSADFNQTTGRITIFKAKGNELHTVYFKP